MGEFTLHHLPLSEKHVRGNGDNGRVFFLPGSDGRARRIAQRFQGLEVLESERQHNVYLGQIQAEDVTVEAAAVSSGMGCPSLNIVLSELILLGARIFIRVGTSGSVSPDVVRAGSLVIATAGVRAERASDLYVTRGYPAVGHPEVIAALERAALKLGHGAQTYKGVVHAKDALYAAEFGHGPRKQKNHERMEELRAMGVLASDMETSHLFIVSDAHSSAIKPISERPTPDEMVRSGSILAVVGDDAPYASKDVVKQAEEAAIDVAVEAGLELFRG